MVEPCILFPPRLGTLPWSSSLVSGASANKAPYTKDFVNWSFLSLRPPQPLELSLLASPLQIWVQVLPGAQPQVCL